VIVFTSGEVVDWLGVVMTTTPCGSTGVVVCTIRVLPGVEYNTGYDSRPLGLLSLISMNTSCSEAVGGGTDTVVSAGLVCSTATVASATTAAATMRLSVLSVRRLVGKLLSALCARVLLLLLAHYGAVTTLMT